MRSDARPRPSRVLAHATRGLAAAVALAATLAAPSPAAAQLSPYFTTDGTAGVGVTHRWEGGTQALSWTWTSGGEIVLYATDTVVRQAVYTGAGSQPGYEYDYAGNPTGGGPYFFGNGSRTAYDAAFDGQKVYVVDWTVGEVYSYDPDFTNRTFLFQAQPYDLGITYDSGTGTLWTTNWQDGLVRQWSMTGAPLASFGVSGSTSNSALAYDPLDQTLWLYSVQTGQYRQYSRTGAPLSSFPGNGYVLGGEIGVPEGGVCPDADGDSYADAACGGDDCDDGDALVNPGQAEILCNGVDDNCNGSGDDDKNTDGDPVSFCGGDCDDTNASVHPGASDASCDGLDNDCNGLVDDAYVPTPTSCGVGECASLGQLACIGGTVTDTCQAGSPSPEVCDGRDNDCDGVVPGSEIDDDGDGQWECQGDCNDADAAMYAGAPELCDGLDNDCDGVVPGVETDDDGDGQAECQGDCDDADAANFSGNAEVCDGQDNDCNGLDDFGAPGAAGREACVVDGGAVCLGEGENAPTCASPDAALVCQGGDLVAVSCGTDSCSDTGTVEGGGACSAVDYACVAGQCGSTGTSGTDTCGGTDGAPSVTYWACNAAGNACEPAVTDRFDNCTDTGTALGGGSCSAIDWQCAGGLLTSTTSGGTDTCGGTDDAPTVTTWACNAGGNACETTTAGESDGCSDSGDLFGGGSCSATDWTCAGGLLTSTSSAGADACAGTDDAPVLTYYACVVSDGAAADTCAPEENAMQDSCADSGTGLGGGSCAATDWDCEGGVLSSTSSSETDTCGGTPDAPSVTTWSCAASDGTAPDACVSATEERADGCTDSGNALGGGACAAVDWRCEDGLLASTGSEGADTCGGDADSPSVTYYTCVAADGGAPDTCTAGETVEHDACTDTGGELGGGACDAVNWGCADGQLGMVFSGGTDACGGDDDTPNVTFWSCAADDGGVADRCVSDVTERSDACVDTGTASGGGTCSATDWSCTDGALAGMSSGGTDTCGDGSEDQTTVYVCAASNGAAADTCVAVPDTAPPVVTCEDEIVVGCTRFGGVFVEVLASVGDVCDDTVPLSNDRTAGGADASDVFPIGATDVTFTATDDAGNPSSCTTTVIVEWTPWSFAAWAGPKGVELGQKAVVDGDVYGAGRVYVKDGALIDGAAFGDEVKVKKKAIVTGGVYAESDYDLEGDATYAGPLPAGLPSAPVLDTAWYDGLLALADAEPKGNVKVTDLVLGAAPLLVNGSFEVKDGGTLTGPGIVVATREIKLGKGVVVGPDVTLVGGHKVKVEDDGQIGAGALLFAADDVEIKKDVSVQGSVLALDDVSVEHDSVVVGLVFAGRKAQIKHRATVQGTVLALHEIDVEQEATLTHDCAAFELLPEGLSSGP